MDKEHKWRLERCGYLTASMLSDITSKSGKIIDVNLTAIRSKRFERKHGYPLQVSSHAMDIGKENEKYVIEWFRNQYPDIHIIYAQELESGIPFWKVDWAKFGASPDAFTEDERIVLDAKTVVSNSNIVFFADEYTSYEEKKAKVWDEHGDQILGLWLSNPKAEEVWIVKYIYCDEFNEFEPADPLAPWRGIVFRFDRKDYLESIKNMKEQIILFDAFIDSDMNPSRMKDGWELVDGKLVKVEKERKSVSG